MKKIFTLMLVAIGISFAAAAQSRDGRYGNDDGYPVNQNSNWDRNDRNPSKEWNRNDRNQSRDYGSNNQRGRNNDYDRQRQAEYERQRQAEYDRMNQDYDRRIDGYRKDRRMDRYERERQIQQAEYERDQKRKAFGNGVVVGGIAAIVLGVLIGGGR